MNLQADGSALYTIQALWTQAREQLDVVTIVYNNRSYAVLNMELDRVGADAPGPKAKSLLDLSRPDIDFVALVDGARRAGHPGDHRRRAVRSARPRTRRAGAGADRGHGPVDPLTPARPPARPATGRSRRRGA